MRFLIVFVFLILLTGCVSLSKNVTVDVTGDEKIRILWVNIPTKDISFNWHGGGFMNGVERYKIIVPKQGARIESDNITLENSHERIALDNSSYIEFEGCTVLIELFDLTEKPLPLNGKFDVQPWSCNAI